VELEIRQDLLMRETDLQSWSERLGDALEGALPKLFNDLELIIYNVLICESSSQIINTNHQINRIGFDLR